MPTDKFVGKEEEKEIVDANFYKCQSCGSMFAFDPSIQKLKCTHCGSTKDIPIPSVAMENKYDSSTEEGYAPWGETKVVKCKSCGAEFVLYKFETAGSCPFCKAPSVVDIDDVPGLKPNGILPFMVSDSEAYTSFVTWVKKRKMAPFGFRKKVNKKDMKGVYAPVFTFDTDTRSHYNIRYGVKHTRTVVKDGKTFTETYTVWYTDSGSYSKFYNDVQVEASRYMTEKNLNKTFGFDTNNAYIYKPQFIAGFEAERYSTGLDDSWLIAKSMIDDSIKNAILSRYNYDVLDYINVDTIYSSKTYKYILVPIWVVAYTYKKKAYSVIINGRNSRADGTCPTSPTKVTALVLFCAAVIGLIVWAILKSQGIC